MLELWVVPWPRSGIRYSVSGSKMCWTQGFRYRFSSLNISNQTEIPRLTVNIQRSCSDYPNMCSPCHTEMFLTEKERKIVPKPKGEALYTCVHPLMILLHNAHHNAVREQVSPWQTHLLFGTTQHVFILVFLASLEFTEIWGHHTLKYSVGADISSTNAASII